MQRWQIGALAALVWAVPARAQETHSPYAHESSRELKTLSQVEVDELVNGAGMGLARAAELNHHPGPRHVIDLADSLGLSAEQLDAAERVFADMSARAKELGREILDAEKALDAAFAAGTVTEGALGAIVEKIAELQGELRLTHLRAHLAMRELLTESQIREYDRLRGYASDHRHSAQGVKPRLPIRTPSSAPGPVQRATLTS
jgi:Spy/CpxP family protein refolding chaperone